MHLHLWVNGSSSHQAVSSHTLHYSAVLHSLHPSRVHSLHNKSTSSKYLAMHTHTPFLGSRLRPGTQIVQVVALVQLAQKFNVSLQKWQNPSVPMNDASYTHSQRPPFVYRPVLHDWHADAEVQVRQPNGHAKHWLVKS